MIGAARALRAADEDFPRPDYLFADSCGTGGDGSGSINVSTAVAFVAAACGLPVAKHGNRSVTSRCGSADVLEQLGAKLDPSPEVSRRALDESGRLLPVRAALPSRACAMPGRCAARSSVRTIMNLLGPCVNPAEPPVQLLGVAEPGAARAGRARPLAALGVVAGAGRPRLRPRRGRPPRRDQGGAGRPTARSSRSTITPERGRARAAPMAGAEGRRARGECRAAEGAADGLRPRRRDARRWRSTPAPCC